MRATRRAISWSRTRLLPTMLLVVLVSGCKKERAAGIPPGPGGIPPLSGEGAGTAPSPSTTVHAPSSSPTETDPSPSTSGVARVAGVIRIDDKLASKVMPGATLFLVARALGAGGAPGSILAVKRLSAGRWPLPFELTQDDVMIAGTRLAGEVVVSVRVDQDGDAMTKQAGDIEGTSAKVTVPSEGVAIVLDRLRAESAGAPSSSMNLGGEKPPGHP